MPVRPTGLAGPLSSASLPRNPALSIDCNEGFGLYLCWGKHSQKLCSSLLIDLYQWALWGEFQIKQEGRGGGTFFIYLFIFFPAMHICTLWFRHDNPFRSSPGKDRDWIGWKRELKTRAKKDRECVKEREGEEERGRERERWRLDGDNGFLLLHGIATDWVEQLRSIVAIVLVRGRV